MLAGDIMTDAMREATRTLAQQHHERAKQATTRLLSQWVSGLEPCLAMDEHYRVIGLSYGGQIVLHDRDEAP